MDCVRYSSCNGCNGGHYITAWDYMKKYNQGFTLLSDYPYTGTDQPCKQYKDVGIVNDW